MESLKIIFLLAFVLMIGGLVFAQMETQLEGGSGERIKRFGYWSGGGGGRGGGHGIHGGGGGGHHGWH
uniref:Uncharacterized protein n=1 Tax=Meloidogyne enterolobii TaxID=390850 RepID=A0A6V7UKY7_MELEN|nr:unnamed protein product [Meloidogyne enterolobii]CAD2167778.1 unnamed protein product [Meloidogyne enterolobii]